MRRALAVLLALVGAAAVFLVLARHGPHTIRGSTTTEFVRTLPRPALVEPGIAWPTYGYDNRRLRSASFHVRPPFRRRWTFHGRALLEFPPVVAYGFVYVVNFNGELFALDARTGKPRWRHSSGRCGWSSPAVADHVLYVTFIGNRDCGSSARDGQVVAYDARTGRRIWLRTIAPTESSPLVAHGTVYVGDAAGGVWALGTRNGRTRWHAELRGAIKGSLALAGGRLFIGTYGGDVVSLDAASGRVLWSSGGHGRFYSSPSVAHGRVYIGSINGGIYAFGQRTGDLLWERPTGGYVYASPAVWNDLVLIGSYDHRFYALDAGSGAVRWRFDAGGSISGAASVIDGLVYFSTFKQRTFALAAATGHKVTSWRDGEYSPAVADASTLYFTGRGRLYALRGAR